ncbi:cofilin family protein [Nocardia sp. NBC_01377]|uniref:hypothetical protein n=1 Tax=Nocardia sp. NBC_01377 TaxID=2903595 RepID=UPI0032487EF4
MRVSLDVVHNDLDDFHNEKVPNRFLRLRSDNSTVHRTGSGTAGTFAQIIEALPECSPCWVLCHFSYFDTSGDPCLEPLILSWAPPALRGRTGARLVLGAQRIGDYFSPSLPQILLYRRMSHEEVAHFLRSLARV